MTTGEIETRLAAMGLTLPEPRQFPSANRRGCVRVGAVMFVSGHGPHHPGMDIVRRGKLGAELTVEQGYEVARACGLSMLATLRAELGDLDRVAGILKVVGFINSAPTFEGQAQVLDGASDLFVELFGDAGRHSRSAPGMAALPGNIAVIVECVAEIKEPDQ